MYELSARAGAAKRGNFSADVGASQLLVISQLLVSAWARFASPRARPTWDSVRMRSTMCGSGWRKRHPRHVIPDGRRRQLNCSRGPAQYRWPCPPPPETGHRRLTTADRHWTRSQRVRWRDRRPHQTQVNVLTSARRIPASCVGLVRRAWPPRCRGSRSDRYPVWPNMNGVIG